MAKGNGKARGRETEVRQLPVKLTEPELLKRGEEMADCELAIETLQGERATVNDGIKVQVKRRAVLAHTIDTGEEARDVRCEWVEDFPKNCFRLVREDTKAVVDTRPMEAKDRVGKLFPESDAEVSVAAAEAAIAPPPRAPKPRAPRASALKGKRQQQQPQPSDAA